MPIVIGSGKHLVRYTDSSGTTHHDQTLNLFCCVGKKKVLITEFAADAPIACIPCLMSHLFGDLRFTVCDQHLTDPANHGTFTSAAHLSPETTSDVCVNIFISNWVWGHPKLRSSDRLLLVKQSKN